MSVDTLDVPGYLPEYLPEYLPGYDHYNIARFCLHVSTRWDPGQTSGWSCVLYYFAY